MNQTLQTYENINVKDQINQFISNVILTNIYDESIKDHPPLVNGYHYISGFNYFMGMRLTINRAELKLV